MIVRILVVKKWGLQCCPLIRADDLNELFESVKILWKNKAFNASEFVCSIYR